MNYTTICILERTTHYVEIALLCIAAPIVFLLVLPVSLFKTVKENAEEWFEKKRCERMLRNWTGTPEDIIKLPSDIRDQFVSEGKIQLEKLPHNHDYCKLIGGVCTYAFHRQRDLLLDFQSIAYVENKYSERMHRFFEEQAEWIKDFEHWHGFNIIFIDCEKMKKGMFFPQDFDNHMNHGFLWDKHCSTSEREYHIYCDSLLYIDLELTSDEDIKRQMHFFMSQIYNTFQWQLI